MTNKLKGMTRRVRLRVQCWWLNREVDQLSRRIAKDIAWTLPEGSDVRYWVN